MRILKTVLTALSLAALALPSRVSAQPGVYVFAPGEAPAFSGPFDGFVNNLLGQKVLVIPVVGSESPLASGSALDPALLTRLRDSMQHASDFWFENSYGKVSLDVKVLDKVYKLPKTFSELYYPPYQKPILRGSMIYSAGNTKIKFPAGTFKVNVGISAADQGSFSLDFLGTDSVTRDSLGRMVGSALAKAGLVDKVEWRFWKEDASLWGGDGLEFAIADRHVEEGSFLRIDPSTSAALIDSLGFDPLTFSATGTGALLRTNGLTYPVHKALWDLVITLHNAAGTTQTFQWASPNDFTGNFPQFTGALDTVLRNQPGVTVSQAADGQLEFNFTPTIALPITNLTVSTPTRIVSPPQEYHPVRDQLGLDSIAVLEGKVPAWGSNVLRVDQNELVGQAIAAYMLHELTTAGTPDIPELDITAANQAELVKRFQDHIDPYRSIVIIFVDPPEDKRAMAGGNYMNIGLINGAYKFTYQTGGANVVQFDFTDGATMVHEFGHNFGLPDLYNNLPGVYEPRLRFPGTWETMDNQTGYPHIGVYCKEVLLGWLGQAGQSLSTVPLPLNPGALTSNFVVTPQELPRSSYDLLLTGAPAGFTVTKGLRIALGPPGAIGDYHFLTLENRAPGQNFSLQLPQQRGGLYVTDNILNRVSDPFTKPEARNFVHPLTDKALIGNNVQVLTLDPAGPEIDFTKTFPAYGGLTLDIVDTLKGPAPFEDRRSYVVQVTRTQTDFMDLVITPWRQPPYESADIWIEHGDKNPLSPVPLNGNGEASRWSANYSQAANATPLNWVRVKVSNTGKIPAKAVRVLVKANTPAGMGDAGKWVSLPLSDSLDIPGESFAIFNVPWNPGTNGHTCLRAEVFRWSNPEADNDPLNNATQENVFSFQPTSASPWTDMPFSFEVGNGFDHPIVAEVQPRGLPRGYSVKLDKPFLTVPAKSQTMVTGVLSLSSVDIPTPPNQDPDDDYWQSCLYSEGGEVHCTRTWHLEAFMRVGDYRVPLGGVTYHTTPSPKATVTSSVTANPNGTITVTGRVTPVSGDPVEVEIAVKEPSGKVTWITVTTGGNGNYGTTFDPGQAGPTGVTVSLPPDGIFAPVNVPTKTVQVCKPRNR